MKKLLTLAAAALAVLALTGCPKDPGTSDPIRKPVTEEVSLGALRINANHPWVDGKQDTSVISNYQAMVDVTSKTGVLKAGDKIVVTWEGVSDIDIPAISIRAIDDSAAAGYWKEIDESQPEGVAIVENVVAGEKFSGEVTLTLKDNAVEKVSLCIYYDAEVGSAANITLPKDGDDDPEVGETVIAEGVKGTFFAWADYGITADNVAEYTIRVTYTLDEETKAGWGPGAFCDAGWANNSCEEALNVTADGVNEIPAADVFEALPEGFLINWWGTYATLIKVEIIKK